MFLLPLFKKIPLFCCFLLVTVVSFSFTGKVGVFINSLPATDTTIITCGTSSVLTAKTVPGFSNRIWNDGSTGTTLTVNASGDYWWQVTGTNIVTNGNFSANSNNRGFNSSYTYKSANSTCDPCCCGVLSLEGTYTINTDPHSIHTNFTSFGDHTTGSGKMLIVNGASIANIIVWTQNINVSPHTDYVFSAWATSVNPQNTAQLQFSINGSPLGSTINPSSDDGVWQYFTTTWNSGNLSGPVPIALINQNIAANGNDFAVDDIVFAPVIRQNIHLTLNPIPVLALNGPHSACDNYDLTKTIVGYDPNTYNYFFTDAGGHSITPVNAPVITQTGTYTITEQNKATGCTSLPKQTTITIKPNPQKPGITAL